jgi:hypothetical protein
MGARVLISETWYKLDVALSLPFTVFDCSSSGGIRNFSSIRFAKEVGPGGFSTHPPSAGSGKRTVLTELEFQWLPSLTGQWVPI